jgi:DNA primase
VLFGIDLARNAIRSTGLAVVVEGYMDALGAHQAGYANVVASMGTALTEAQFRQLAKLCKKFILALDPDTAGVHAMLRGLEVARETLDRDAAPVFDARGLVGYEGHLRVDIRVLVMPGGRDPDEVIRDDPAGWPRLVENALPVVEYVIQTLAAGRNLQDPKEKAAFSRQVVPVIRDVADPVERAHYAQRLARLLRVDERTILEQLGGATLPKTRRPVGASEAAADRKASDLEAHCLTVLLQSPAALMPVDEALKSIDLDPLSGDDFDNAAHGEILAAIREAIDLTGLQRPVRSDDLREFLDETLWPYLAALSEDAPQPTSIELPDWEREAVQSVLRLRERNLKRQQQELDVLTRDALDEGQADVARDLGEQGHRNAIAINRLQKVRWPGEIARLSTSAPWRRPTA